MPAVYMTPARIALSIPLVNALAHPLVAGPVFASHPFDLQDFTLKGQEESVPAHVGPPSISVEAKLVGVDDDTIENGGDPFGWLYVRGPSVGRMGDEDHENYAEVSSDDKDEREGWVSTEVEATIFPNGSFLAW